jgi:hypothetical protein
MKFQHIVDISDKLCRLLELQVSQNEYPLGFPESNIVG